LIGAVRYLIQRITPNVTVNVAYCIGKEEMAQAPNKKRRRRKKKKKHNIGKQKSPTLGLAIRRWEDEIKMDLHEVRWKGGGEAWTGLIWLRTGADGGLL
jgi:hypothetical protein